MSAQNYKIMPSVKHDQLLNFYISLEKREKLRYLCNRKTNLHKIEHGDAKCASYGMQGC